MIKRLALPLGMVALLAVALGGCGPRDVSTVARPYEPVVLTGAQVPGLQGASPSRLVAFRFVFGTWQQVPVQVDERAVIDLNVVRHGTPVGRSATLYTDPTTWVGADPDPNLDADDQIVFMAGSGFGEARSIDEGDTQYSLDEPDHVVAGSGVQVRFNDPLKAGSAAWIYLFRSDGTITGGAGVPPTVSYAFNLQSGNYKTTYKNGDGANPEVSTVTTPRYSATYTDRWIQSELRIRADGATNVDILDGHKAGFAGTCARSETTFSTGGGGMIANKSGPVRAIRSYLGANSGTFSQRDHIFYESRIDTVTYLRVHAVPPLRDWLDLSPAAVGMNVSASTATAGVTVDGVPDSFPSAFPTWQMARGSQGSIVNTSRIDTNIPNITASLVNFYEDSRTPADQQCSGDAFSYGAHGSTVNQNVPDTDPRTSTNTFASTRRTTVLGPNAPTATAQSISAQDATPLTVAISPFTP